MHSTQILRQLIKNSASQSSAHRQLCLLRLRRVDPARSLSTESTGSSSPVPPPLPPSDSAAAPSNPGPPEDDKGSEAPPADIGSVHSEELARVKARRARISTPTKEVVESIELPAGLDVLWLPQDQPDPTAGLDPVWPADLPPSEILNEAHNNLLITLQPLIQHRATYPPPNSDHPTEPTLGLYCPIEGGEYIIDATVKELARRAGADVVVLDSVQLAAGEWGHFGKAASSLQLPVNPLKVPASTPGAHLSREADEDFDEEDVPGLQPQGMMTLTLLAPPAMSGRGVIPAPRRSPARSKMNALFDALVNAPSSSEGPAQTHRPRIIYVRDFTTLAATSSVWYAPLLAAVRQRRRGPISRPTSPISNPITIVFGMTPPLQVPTSNHGGPNTSVVNFLVNQNASPGMIGAHEAKPEVPDWSESEAGERARERRLQDRLKKWEKHEASLLQELPRLTLSSEDEAGDAGKGDVIVVGPAGGRASLPSFFGGGAPAKPVEGEKKSSFFRTSILVPAKRSHPHEKETRVARRREINELTMRMGVGGIGGRVEPAPAAQQFTPVLPATSETPVPEPTEDAAPSDAKAKKTDAKATMWDAWGERIEVWPKVKRIADSAVGRVLSDSGAFAPSLNSTVVPWSTVEAAWDTCKASKGHRKAWLKDLAPTSKGADSSGTKDDTPTVDELVERVRDAADLDQYEQRLLGCIVDAASMPTSFKEVHLPPHVIDSVRTIVSLPLLHPHAFQQGILKQHGMTGCLLFGPPGTGKTLTVRALAREAGCRMLVITPSDIMDMYVGEAEKLVRATFSLARRLSPCVVFLDELDALFGARMAARESGGAAAAHRGVITEFMQEMDGLKSSREDGVIVIGATNRPFDLDDAILRRLPRRLLVDLPGEKEREEILKILLKDETIGEDVTPQFLAKKTESFSGSDLKHLCVSAALDAVKENVQVPWITSHQLEGSAKAEPSPAPEAASTPSETAPASKSTVPEEDSSTPSTQPETPPVPSRTLHLRNFLKALKEITPSSSEALGSLADLRKWNEEFGEGRAQKKYQVWGKGRFGFIDEKVLKKAEEAGGKVAQP